MSIVTYYKVCVFLDVCMCICRTVFANKFTFNVSAKLIVCVCVCADAKLCGLAHHTAIILMCFTRESPLNVSGRLALYYHFNE